MFYYFQCLSIRSADLNFASEIAVQCRKLRKFRTLSVDGSAKLRTQWGSGIYGQNVGFMGTPGLMGKAMSILRNATISRKVMK